MSNIISPLISSQFPAYVQEQFPTFVDFITDYYKWLEQPGNAGDLTLNFLEYSDIDSLYSGFISQFRKTYCSGIPGNTLVSDAFLIKHVKELYTSKGTEEAFKFLIRILFNDEVTFYYPNDDILRVSDGTWIEDKIIRTTATTANFGQFTGRIITGQTSGASAGVEKVFWMSRNGIQFLQIYLSNISGTFIANEIISCPQPNGTIISETVFGILIGTQIINQSPPAPVFVDEWVTGIDNGSGATAKIASIDGYLYGAVQSTTNTGSTYHITLPGSLLTTEAYYPGMKIEFMSGILFGVIATISAYDDTMNIITVTLSGTPGKGDLFRILLSLPLSIAVVDPGLNYTTNFQITAFNTNIEFLSGTIFSYPGYYRDDSGFLSDIKILQDSYYYQLFSYVLRFADDIMPYINEIKALLHPAGTTMFSEIDIINNFKIGNTFRKFEKDKSHFLVSDFFNISVSKLENNQNNEVKQTFPSTITIA